MLTLALLLLVAAVGHGISVYTNAPSAPLMVLGGILLSVSGTLPPADLESILVLAVAVLLFTAGTALGPSPAGGQRAVAFRVGILQFLCLGGVGLLLALGLGYEAQASLHIAVAVAASSTLVGVRLLQQRRQLFEPFGRLVVGVLLLQDLLVILMIPVLTNLESGTGTLLRALGATIGLVLTAYLLRERFWPALLDRLDLDSETWLLVFLAMLFVFMGVADLMDVPIVTAAFLAGVSLSRFPVSSLARGQLGSLTDFFSALFFTTLGTVTAVPGVQEIVHGLAFSVAVVLVTPVVVALAAERWGFTARASILAGLLLSQTSEFSLVVALQGVLAGHLAAGTFTVVAVFTVITMTATPLLATDRITWSLVHLHPSRARPGSASPPKNHVLLLGCGSNGTQVLDLLFMEGVDVMVVDEDPGVVGAIDEAGIPVIRGDAGDPVVLEAAGARQARVVVSTLRRVEDNEAVLAMAGDVPVLVRAFEEDEADWIRQRGGTALSFAEATADHFMQWFREFSANSPTSEQHPFE